MVEGRDLAHVHVQLEGEGAQQGRGDQYTDALLRPYLLQQPVQRRHAIYEGVGHLQTQHCEAAVMLLFYVADIQGVDIDLELLQSKIVSCPPNFCTDPY